MRSGGSIFSRIRKCVLKKSGSPKTATGVLTSDDVLGMLSGGRLTSDQMVMVSEWFSYPASTLLGVAFVCIVNNSFEYPQSMRKFWNHPTVAKGNTLSKYSIVTGDWSGYIKVRGKFCQLIVCVNDTATEIERFLCWLPSDLGTAALVIADDINILVLADILRRVAKHFHLFGARGVDLYPLMTLVPSETMVVEQPLPLVSSKVTNADLGMARSSEYLVGQNFHTNFMNAMIEFRYSTLLSDSFNAKEYDFYISSIGDNLLKISSDVISQLGGKSFNLYDNIIKRWLVKEDDTKKYNFGYINVRYVRLRKYVCKI